MAPNRQYDTAYRGTSSQSINGLRQVMDAVGEEVEAATYKHCQLYIRDAYTAISAACVADHESQATASGAATE